MRIGFFLVFFFPVIVFAQQNVGIGTTTPQSKLDILSTGDGAELLRLSTDRPWIFRQRLTGADTRLSLQSTVDVKVFEILSENGMNHVAEFHANNVASKILLVPDEGSVGIGQVWAGNPLGLLHLTDDSHLGNPQVRLTEIGFDYARIKMENTAEPGTYWDIAGRPDSSLENSKFNIFYSGPMGGGDRLTITGKGDVGIGRTTPEAKLDILGGDWNLDAGNPGDVRIGNSTYNLRIGVATAGGGAGTVRMYSKGGYLLLGTENTAHMFITTYGDVGVGTDAPAAKLGVVNPDPMEKAIYAELPSMNQDNISIHSKVLGPYGTAVYGQTTNGAGGIGIHGEVAGNPGTAILGHATATTGSTKGVHGLIESKNGIAVYAESTSLTGQNHGIWSTNASNEGVGVYGVCTASSGTTTSIYGWNYSATGRAVQGIASSTSGNNVGVGGTTYSDDGVGVFAVATSTTGSTFGTYAYVESDSGTGVYGEAVSSTGTTYGVRGNTESGEGTGVFGHATALTGPNRGVYGNTNSDEGIGVYGLANKTTGDTRGVYGKVFSSSGIGVYGEATSGSGTTYGVYGKVSSGGTGVYGENTKSSGDATGVVGKSSSTGGIGVYGTSSATTGSNYGVWGTTPSTSGTGVYGIANATSGTTSGVHGNALSPSGRGVYGQASGDSGKALYGYATGIYGKGLHAVATGSHSSVNAILADADAGSAYAGYFIGRVHVTGTLSKGGGSFKIDHPLDPANKYLSHSFVESPDMMNIYNGNTITDGSGYATVELPDYFDALNMDFRYQLTVIGDFAQAIIAEEISSNTFVIQTDKPGIKVSWQVTGVRKDKWAEANRIVPEMEKEPENKGKFLAPELFGRSADEMIGRVPVNEQQ